MSEYFVKNDRNKYLEVIKAMNSAFDVEGGYTAKPKNISSEMMDNRIKKLISLFPSKDVDYEAFRSHRGDMFDLFLRTGYATLYCIRFQYNKKNTFGYPIMISTDFIDTDMDSNSWIYVHYKNWMYNKMKDIIVHSSLESIQSLYNSFIKKVRITPTNVRDAVISDSEKAKSEISVYVGNPEINNDVLNKDILGLNKNLYYVGSIEALEEFNKTCKIKKVYYNFKEYDSWYFNKTLERFRDINIDMELIVGRNEINNNKYGFLCHLYEKRIPIPQWLLDDEDVKRWMEG